MITYRKSDIPGHLQQYFQPTEIGLEPAPEEYVEKLVGVFREVRRVMRPDGVLWFNLGSCYASRDMLPTQLRPYPNVTENGSGDKEQLGSPGPDPVCCRSDGECPSDSQNHRLRNFRSGPTPAEAGSPPRKISHDSGPEDSSLAFPGAFSRDVLGSKTPGASIGNVQGASARVNEALESRKQSRSSSCESRGYAHRAGCISDRASPAQTSAGHMTGKELSSGASAPPSRESTALSSLYYTIAHLGFKQKDLIPIPALVALALQADGWYLRRDIIWMKPNPRPESVEDRPTCSHEYVFLLSKSERYFYDHYAIMEEQDTPEGDKSHHAFGAPGGKVARVTGRTNMSGGRWEPTGYRNKRDVWIIPTQALTLEMCEQCKMIYTQGRYRRLKYIDTETERKRICAECGEMNWLSHFAVFPEKLAEVCILAATSEKGTCAECGQGWRRVVNRSTRFEGHSAQAGRTAEDINRTGKWAGRQDGKTIKMGPVPEVETIGWEPDCGCGADVAPAVVLDPFMGSGTTGLVAWRLGRNFVGFDLNEDYCRLANHRIREGMGISRGQDTLWEPTTMERIFRFE